MNSADFWQTHATSTCEAHWGVLRFALSASDRAKELWKHPLGKNTACFREHAKPPEWQPSLSILTHLCSDRLDTRLERGPSSGGRAVWFEGVHCSQLDFSWNSTGFFLKPNWAAFSRQTYASLPTSAGQAAGHTSTKIQKVGYRLRLQFKIPQVTFFVMVKEIKSKARNEKLLLRKVKKNF